VAVAATARVYETAWVLNIPDVKYVRTGGVAVAYQVVGEGPRELVFVPFLSNLLTLWELPVLRRLFDRLAAETRLTLVNPRGMGLSDRPRTVTIEDWMDDIRKVLDAEEVERASVFGTADSANAALLLAATHPERVERLVLVDPFPRLVRAPGYDHGLSEEEALASVQVRRDRWNDRDFMLQLAKHINPEWAADEAYLEWFVWNHRLTASPATAAEFRRMQVNTDVTDILGAVRVPTLVFHRADMRFEAEYLTARIPNASRIEVPGTNSTPADDAIIEPALAFLRGESPRIVSDAVLATLLFTDLVGSTTMAAEVGDRGWRDLLEQHHAAVRREVARFRGSVLDTAGDGFFCRFDGPARAIACAREIAARAPELGLAVRAGVHTGECEVAGEKLVGLSVVISARVMAQAAGGEVLVSSTVKDLVAGSGLEFEDRGEHELKGVPGPWRLYAVS
jgi:class 3 adenylate cyclase